MPHLSRSAKRLLSTVDGKPHATQDDHDDPIMTSQSERNDINRSPLGSSDEEDVAAAAKLDIPSGFRIAPSLSQPLATNNRPISSWKDPGSAPTGNRRSSRGTKSDASGKDKADIKSSVSTYGTTSSRGSFMTAQEVAFAPPHGVKRKKTIVSYSKKNNFHVSPELEQGREEKENKTGEHPVQNSTCTG
jgi:hypothetical protein